MAGRRPLANRGWLVRLPCPNSAYCSSLGGIRGGSSGVNDTSSPARGAAINPPPVEGSPPDVSMMVFGVMYSRTASSRPPSPLPKSAARPPWGRPAAISLDRLVGLFGERVAVGKPVGPGDAARPIALVERLDPQIDRARIALQRMRLDDPRLQQLEARRAACRRWPSPAVRARRRSSQCRTRSSRPRRPPWPTSGRRA